MEKPFHFLKKDRYMKKSNHHIRILVNAFIEARRRLKYSTKSLDVYQNALKSFTGYLEHVSINRIQDVASGHIDGYRLSLVDLGFTDAGITLYLQTVRSFFKYLEDNRHIFINPAATLIVPGYPRKLLPVPSEKDIEKVLLQPDITSTIGIRDRAILETAYTSGIRREELFNLTVFDPDIKQGTLRVKGKGNKERTVPLGKKAVYWLKQYMENARPKLLRNPDENALWISRIKGGRLSVGGIGRLIEKHGKAAGTTVLLSAHAIRRACVTHMLQNGAHPIEIQLLLGHASLHTLSQYLRVTITDLKKMHERSKPGK